MRATLTAIFLVWASASGAQEAMISRCEAANPSFPKLCACAVQEGTEAGITPEDLAKLVSNEFVGVSPTAVAAWGPIFANCTAQAVNADLGLPGAPQIQTEHSPQPSIPQPQPSAPPETTQKRDAQPVPETAKPALRLSMSDPGLAPGQWGNLVFERPGASARAMIGTRSAQGPLLALQCRSFHGTEFPHLILGPFTDGPEVLQARLDVTGRSPYRRGVPLQRIEGGFYVGALYEDMAQAFSRGAEALFDLEPLGSLSIGLKGSSKTIRDQFSCGGRPGLVRALAHPQPMDIRFEGRWVLTEGRLGRDIQPVLAFPSAYQVGADIALTCDRRVTFSPNMTPYPLPLPGALEYQNDGQTIQHSFTFSLNAGNYISSEPLDPMIFEEIAETASLTVYFNADFAEGADFDAIFEQTVSTDGFAEGLANLDCPVIEPLGPTAKIDLTGSGGVWEPIDMAQLNGSSTPIPAAVFNGVEAGPGLSMYCGPAPFFWSGSFEIRPPVDVRFEVDGDAASAVETDFTSYRALLHTNWTRTDPLAAAMLTGRTLRVTSLQDRNVDVLYPLEGLAEALQEAGCPPSGRL